MKAKRTPQRFVRPGRELAIDPRAFFEIFFEAQSRDTQRVGNVDVIEINGPLVQRDELWCDSYESIRARFTEACAGDASAIVLRFDSPGGDASGCFETARALRAEAIAAGKPLYAYVDRSCSAAYALATSATHGIAIGETCCAGSVGVLCTRPDYTVQNAMQGFGIAFVTSGQRKLDGNPDYPITEAELARTQQHVDDLAAKFFGLIEDMRPQLSAATVEGFDGGVFYGDGAVSAGLADGVATFEQLLALAATGDPMQPIMQAKSDYDTARAALEKVAKGSDANAAAARKALAAMAEGEPSDDDEDDKEDKEDKPASEGAEGGESAESSDDDEPAADGGDAPPPAASDEPADDEVKPKKPESSSTATTGASAQSTELKLAERVHRLEAKIDADREARQRKALLAKRPDFGPEVRAVLSKVSISALKEAVETWPKKAVAPKQRTAAAAATVAGTRGQGQASDPAVGTKAERTRHSGSDADELDRAMGFATQKLGARREGSTMYFGFVPSDDNA